ncbi:MAG: hypothetical protein RLZZ576_423 [Actinomycetota bacterium]|jgi:hypothetical protein
MSEKPGLGVGRLLIAVYAVFALSATARAGYQLFREFDEAPVAYTLSLVSALTYILVTIALTKKGDTWASIARITVWFELFGVIAVGIASLALPSLFNHPSVWSGFGMGYGFLPLVLPVLGILWLSRRRK